MLSSGSVLLQIIEQLPSFTAVQSVMSLTTALPSPCLLHTPTGSDVLALGDGLCHALEIILERVKSLCFFG